MMQSIEEKSEGAWRPGPGTVYPLLKGLVAGGLAKKTGPLGNAGSRKYMLTAKGRQELIETQRTIASKGNMEKALMALFTDVLPGKVYIEMTLRRYKRGAEVFKQKVAEVSKSDREMALKELRVFFEAQMRWIDSQLRSEATSSRP